MTAAPRASRISGQSLHVPAAFLLAGIFASFTAHACPYSIRDAAFLTRENSDAAFTLYVRSSGEENAAAADVFDSHLAAMQAAWLAETNVSVRSRAPSEPLFAHASSPEDSDLDAKSQREPTAVLLDRSGRALNLSNKPLADRQVLFALAERVVTSPVRRTIRESLLRNWCVVLLICGADDSANATARQAIHRAVERIRGHHTELGLIISSPPRVLEVAHDDPAERVLLWSLRLRETASSGPRAIMLVGRGEQRASVLRGAAIRAETLYNWFEMLGKSCSCTTAPEWLSGPSIPLTWGKKEEELAESVLGFDPADPDVLESVRGAARGPRSGPNPTSDPLNLGYQELSLIGPNEDHKHRPPLNAGSESDQTTATTLPAGHGETVTPPKTVRVPSKADAQNHQRSSLAGTTIDAPPEPPQKSSLSRGTATFLKLIAWVIGVALVALALRTGFLLSQR